VQRKGNPQRHTRRPEPGLRPYAAHLNCRTCRTLSRARRASGMSDVSPGRFMTEQFPDNYPVYKRSTKMLVPFIF
jgi:hypothetical protein